MLSVTGLCRPGKPGGRAEVLLAELASRVPLLPGGDARRLVALRFVAHTQGGSCPYSASGVNASLPPVMPTATVFW